MQAIIITAAVGWFAGYIGGTQATRQGLRAFERGYLQAYRKVHGNE